ncbi:PaaX family transcriptional regulator C-terminal domain-containing protein [Streptomyces sp. C10-9-1]|uniref:PaaX family transcriptional regulator C-terminal domain-containing protein n=1 Tax=Streptomyces sp. C10-9-1 TaxID=1859285 RepID=UPI003D73342E
MTAARPAPEGTGPAPEVPTRLLVHALVRQDGTVDAGELYAVAGVLGMTDQQVRLCVKRLVAEGRFTQVGRGRKAVLRAVADATGSVAPDAAYVRHAYRQDAGLAPWDGRWHLFGFAVPESRRTARDTLRDILLHLGAAPVQGGLYVTANDVGVIVEAHARELGVLDGLTRLTSTDLSVGGQSEPRALAAALWTLGPIAARYEELEAFAASCLERLPQGHGLPGPERLTMAVRLAAVFSRAMEPDPLLPPELLPRPWPGARARGLAAECWSRLAAMEPAGGAAAPRLFALYADTPAAPQGGAGRGG